MSTLIVDICKVKKVFPHNNADNLEIAEIKGWQCIVGKGEFITDDLVLFIPPDSVVPQKLSDYLNITGYLSKQRVRTIKLRGVISQGIAVDVQKIAKYIEEDESHECLTSYTEVGDNMAEVLGIKKYEPPVTLGMKGDTAPDNIWFNRYTDIERFKNYPDVLYEGEHVVITEKIHGTNFRCGLVQRQEKIGIPIDEYVPFEFCVGSHNRNLKETDNNLYWQIAKKYKLKEILPKGTVLYGEVYGRGVQNMLYNAENCQKLLVFDIKKFDKYMDYGDLIDFCKANLLPIVPMLYTGSFKKELLHGIVNGESRLAKHMKEGIVIRPAKERWDRRTGRVILKYISEEYELKTSKKRDKFNH